MNIDNQIYMLVYTFTELVVATKECSNEGYTFNYEELKTLVTTN